MYTKYTPPGKSPSMKDGRCRNYGQVSIEMSSKVNKELIDTKILRVWKALKINNLERKRITKTELAFELLYFQ